MQDRAQTVQLLAERAENTRKVSELVAESASRCDSEHEKQRLSAVEEARKSYVDSYMRALDLLVNEGKHDRTVTVMVNETLPALFMIDDRIRSAFHFGNRPCALDVRSSDNPAVGVERGYV